MIENREFSLKNHKAVLTVNIKRIKYQKTVSLLLQILSYVLCQRGKIWIPKTEVVKQQEVFNGLNPKAVKGRTDSNL